jgi:hypothetical protein
MATPPFCAGFGGEENFAVNRLQRIFKQVENRSLWAAFPQQERTEKTENFFSVLSVHSCSKKSEFFLTFAAQTHIARPIRLRIDDKIKIFS